MDISNFINNHKWIEWVFGSIGVVGIKWIFDLLKPRSAKNKNNFTQTQTTNVVVNAPVVSTGQSPDKKLQSQDIDYLKTKIKTLFIDDDRNFKIVQILKKDGWVKTKALSDVRSLGLQDIQDAHILFIDINGVGMQLGFKDQGLGLASALMEKYPEKKVIIYSAETQGDRLHPALNQADTILHKNAEPYEFIQAVEQFSKELAI